MNPTSHRGTHAALALGGAMTQSETLCREFAAQHPTPNVLRGVELAEAGRITWDQFARIAADALRAGIAAVTA